LQDSSKFVTNSLISPLIKLREGIKLDNWDHEKSMPFNIITKNTFDQSAKTTILKSTFVQKFFSKKYIWIIVICVLANSIRKCFLQYLQIAFDQSFQKVVLSIMKKNIK